jgi:hypothetical protein
MGMVVLHSGHLSKPFLRLMGTSGRLRWRLDTPSRVAGGGLWVQAGVGSAGAQRRRSSSSVAA